MTNPPPNTTIYKGFIDALIKIRRDEGFKGLYKGFVPGIWGVSHGAIQFMAYEELKNAYNVKWKNQPVDTKLVSLIIYLVTFKKIFERCVILLKIQPDNVFFFI